MPADLLTFKIKLCSSQNNHKTESRKCSAWKVVRPVTAEILLPKRLCGGGWWLVVVVCKPILVFSLSLGQAEQ